MPEGKPFIKCGELFDCSEAFGYSEDRDRLFVEAMNEALSWHSLRCADYRAFLAENGLADFRKKYEPEQIPPVLTDVFKEFYLSSVPEKLVKFELTSKNTDNKKNSQTMDARSHKRILKILENVFNAFGLVDTKQKVNYICFYPDPKYAAKPNVYDTKNLLTDLTAHRSVYYALKYDKKSNEFKFDLEAVAKKIMDFSVRFEPIRIIGSLSCLKRVFCWLEDKRTELKLGKKSYVIAINPFEEVHGISQSAASAREEAQRLLGIPRENFRELFTVAEHQIPYLSCEAARLHVPIYARASVLDPESLFPLEEGKEGLLCFMTPYISSYPAISILTAYKAVIEGDCPCGRGGKTFRIVGKALYGGCDFLEFNLRC